MPRRQQDEEMAMELARRIGERIHRLRQLRGLTQAGFSERLGISAEAYGRIERGESLPSFPTFVRACEKLGTTSDRLLAASRSADLAEPAEAVWLDRSPEFPQDGTDSVVAEIRRLDPRARRAVAEIVRLLWHGSSGVYPQDDE